MFLCNKCEKKFNRKIDLERHLQRKTLCYKNLNCPRCNQLFTKKYNLESHLNRKNPCKDNRELVDLKIKLEEAKLKTEEMVLKQTETQLKIEQEKNKGKIISSNIVNNIQIASGDINNIFNININNIENLDQHQYTYNEAVKFYSDDILTLISNVFKHQYNSQSCELENNKCIKIDQKSKGLKKYIIKSEGKIKKAAFKDIRENVLKNYKYMIDTTVGNFIQTENRISKKKDVLPEYKIEGYEKSLNFTHNIRNNGMIDKTLKNAIPNHSNKLTK